MDNKITKRRLSEFLSYEWIMMIIISVVAIIVWELIFTMTSVRLTVGQQFKYYYDQGIYSDTDASLYTLFPEYKTFSYDVLEINSESLNEDYNVLSARLSIQEGDVIITSGAEPKEEDKDKNVRVKGLVDGYKMYDYGRLLTDAEKYLAQFLKDGLTAETANVADSNNLDTAKIESVFRERMKKDNRFRSEEQKKEGVKQEVERIFRLCEEVAKFRVLLSQGDDYFYMYRRYEQIIELGNLSDSDKQGYEKYMDKEPLRYGLKVEKLIGAQTKHSASEFFKLGGNDNAKDVVICVFDFLEYQPHLQFETISFINTIVESCSNLYDGI